MTIQQLIDRGINSEEEFQECLKFMNTHTAQLWGPKGRQLAKMVQTYANTRDV